MMNEITLEGEITGSLHYLRYKGYEGRQGFCHCDRNTEGRMLAVKISYYGKAPNPPHSDILIVCRYPDEEDDLKRITETFCLKKLVIRVEGSLEYAPGTGFYVLARHLWRVQY